MKSVTHRIFSVGTLSLGVGVLSLFVALLVGCESQKTENTGKPVVYTSFCVMTDFAKKIGGEHIDVRCIMPDGGEVHHWEPSPRDMARLQQADGLICNGAGMEIWGDKVQEVLKSKKVKVLEASKGLPVTGEHLCHHDHAAHHEHDADHDHDHDAHHEHDHDADHDHEHEAEHHHSDADHHDHEADVDHDADQGHYAGDADHHDEDGDHDGNHEHHDGDADRHDEDGDHDGNYEYHDGDADHHDEGADHDHEAEHHSDADHDHDHEAEHHHDHDADHDHDHAHGHAHHHHGVDPHVWLAPLLAKQEMANICEFFCELDPAHAEDFKNNYAKYAAECDALDQEYREASGKMTCKTLIVTHAAFGYLCRAYGLEQVPLEGLQDNSEPDLATMAKLVELAKAKDIRTVYCDTTQNRKTAEALAKEIGGTVKELNPIGRLSRKQLESGEDYFSVMRRNLKTLME